MESQDQYFIRPNATKTGTWELVTSSGAVSHIDTLPPPQGQSREMLSPPSEAALWFKRGWTHSLRLYLTSLSNIGSSTQRTPAPSSPTTLDEHPQRLPLQKPTTPLKMSAGLMERRTHRNFRRQECSLEAFSAMLWEGIAVPLTRFASAKLESGFDFRVVVFSVQGLKAGVYRYHYKEHELSLIQEGNWAEEVSGIVQGLIGPKNGNFTLFVCANIPWFAEQLESIRDLYLSSGRSMQSFILACTALGFGALPTPAIADTKAEKLLGLASPEEIAVYSCTVGHKTR